MGQAAGIEQRAFIGAKYDGSIDFGYGELTDERTYDTFIGGLHSLYNDLKPPPETAKGLQHQHGAEDSVLPPVSAW